jgi:Flp pilus assembly pilin Flp
MTFNSVYSFLAGESGAITVDWVVLTAAIAGLGLAVVGVVSGGLENIATEIGTHLASQEVDTAFDGEGALN